MNPILLPPFRLDPAARVLYRDGEIERIPPRTLEVLLALLERRGEVVTKQELLERVWPDTIVEEGNLSVHVSLLRKTLGDAVPIETVAKRGYRVSPSTIPPASAAIRDELLRGRHFWRKLSRTALERGQACFLRAAQLDPDSGEAQSGLADTRIMQGLFGFEPGRRPFEEALGHAEAARHSSLDSADAHTSYAFAVLLARFDLAAAERALARARQIAPGKADPLVWSAVLSALAGRLAEAATQARQALQLDPLSITAGVGLGLQMYFSPSAPELRSFEAVLELEPESAIAHWGLGLALDRLGRHVEAAGSHRRASALAGGSLTLESNLARSLALAGQTAEAEAALRELESRGLAAYRVATVEAALGQPRRAMLSLERAAAERDPWLVWLRVDPMLDSLRADPAFAALTRAALTAASASS